MLRNLYLKSRRYDFISGELPGRAAYRQQETARLEAQAYELEQKTAMAAEGKAVLDSWVRYEGQVRQRQQKELAENIIGKITKELENPRTLQQILNQSVADVERKQFQSSAINVELELIELHRNRIVEGAIRKIAVVYCQACSSNTEFLPC